MQLFEELKRRNVFRVGAAYVVAAWLLLQVADLVLENLDAPLWIMQVFMLAVAIGFPVVLMFAWVFEITPEGVKLDSEVDHEAATTSYTGKRLNRAIMVMLVLAVAYLLTDKFFLRAEPDEPIVTEVAGETTAAAGTTPAERAAPSIAIIPFDNRSQLEDDRYFVAGIHDDLLTTVAQIGSLKVISRSSVERYATSSKSIPEIAGELGVTSVMEGSVQRSGDQVRINVQLIDAATDQHLWAETFDRELTAENLFAIQSEISEAIARELHATLSPREQARISQVPTRNTEAYEAYMRGRILLETRHSADLEEALKQFRHAVALDPNFALAWVGMSVSAQFLVTYGSMSPTDAREISQIAVSRALEIDPELGEAYAAKAQLAQEIGDFSEAEQLFRRAIELSPNSASSYLWLGNQINDYPQRYAEAMENLEKAAELDPQSLIVRSNVAAHYLNTGKFDKSEQQYRTILDIDPGFAQAWFSLGNLYIAQGRLADALKARQQAYEVDPGNRFALSTQGLYWLHLGAPDEAWEIRNRLEELEPGGFGGHFVSALIAVYEHDGDRAREWFETVVERYPDFAIARDIGGHHFAYTNQPELARRWLMESNDSMLDPESRFLEAQLSSDHACITGWALMETGETVIGREIVDEAIRFIQQDLGNYVEHTERWPLPTCLAIAGDHDEALDALLRKAQLGLLTFWWAESQASWWDPVRDDPRFLQVGEMVQAHVAAERDKLLNQ